jgi:hypothetical protein
MHPFENFTMRIADYEGWAEEMRGIWESHRGEYQHQLTEDSPLVNYIRCWLGKDDRNIGRWVRTGQLYQELADRYGKLTQSWRTDAAFGRKLKENETALHLLGIQKRFRHGSTEWRFDPPSEEAERCKNAYADSARKDDKTWKSEEV